MSDSDMCDASKAIGARWREKPNYGGGFFTVVAVGRGKSGTGIVAAYDNGRRVHYGDYLEGIADPVSAPAVKGPHGTLACPCGGTDYLGAPHDEGCAVPRRRPIAKPAPHHNADYLTALAALEASEGVTRETRPVHHCRHVTCRVCRPVVAEPFVAKVDLYDLLPDAP